VEILSALQERFPAAPQVASDDLGKLRTLAQVVAYLEPQNAEVGIPVSAHANGNGTTHGTQQAQRLIDERAARATQHDLASALLEIVSEKTGYPRETLGLEMDLEADLGIDSIKRVEILSALQERFPAAPQVASDDLGKLRTLAQIVAYLEPHPDAIRMQNSEQGHDSRTAADTPEVHAAEPETKRLESAPLATTQPLQRNPTAPVERLVLFPTPLPADGSARRIPLLAGSEIWISDDDPALAAALVDHLRDADFRAKLISLRALPNAAPLDLAGLILLSPRAGQGDDFLKAAFRCLRQLSPALRATGQRSAAVLVTVSRLDGGFGLLDLNGDALLESGGLAGLAKTARHEWPAVQVKAVDLAPEINDVADAAVRIAHEMLHAGPIEVGLAPNARWTLDLLREPLPAEDSERPLTVGDVVIITGGARGVTAEVALALGQAFRPVLVLLGRSPAPQPEPTWLVPLESALEIKRALAERGNGSSTPKTIEAEYRRLAANREVLCNLQRLEAAGCRAVYRAVDVRDAQAVRAALQDLRELGPVRGLIHGAGVLADRLIEEKTDAQFDLVYGTKVEGLRNLLDALADDELKVLVTFSSTTGRYGRRGQADYAAANEVLNKIAQHEARRRPGCRVVSVNWGPWEGGMVTPSLKSIFEREGVALIGLRAGAEYLVREICSNGKRPVEITVLAHGTQTPDSSGNGAVAVRAPTSRVPAPDMTPAFQFVLDQATHPFLASHVLGGNAVLPLAMAAEWLAQGAMHLHPGLAFHGFNQLRVLKGVILKSNAPCGVRVLSGRPVQEGDQTRVPMELWGAVGSGPERLRVSAEVLLVPELPQAPNAAGLPPLRAYPHGSNELYSELLFHGPAFQGIERVEGCSEVGIAATVRSAPQPSEWMRDSLRGAWVTDPLVLDCAFQLMILWSIERHGAGSLPTCAHRFRQYRRAYPRDGVRIVIHVTKDRSHQATADVEILDAHGLLIARLEDYECTIDSALQEAFRKNLLST